MASGLDARPEMLEVPSLASVHARRQGGWRPTLVLVVAAGVLATFIGFASAQLTSDYLQRHPFFGDTATYYRFQADAWARTTYLSRWEAARQELLANDRFPLRTVPYLLLAPDLLITRSGHLVSGTLMLFVFLALFGLTVYRRTGSLPYALTGLGTVLLAQSLFEPLYGHGGNYPDLHAAYLTGSALLCLLLSNGARDLRWLAAFGACCAGAALARWVAGGYTLAICGPVLAWYLLRRLVAERDPLRAVAYPLLATGLPIVVLAGYYIVAFTGSNLRFYGVTGYPFRSPSLVESISNVGHAFRLFLGVTGIVGLALLAIVYVKQGWRARADLASFLLPLASGFSFLVFTVLILGVTSNPLVPLFILPNVLLLTVAPFGLRRAGDHGRADRLAFGWRSALAVLVLLGWTASQHVAESDLRHRFPTQIEQDELSFQRDLAFVTLRFVDALEPGSTVVPTFDAYFRAFGRSVVAEAAMTYRKEVRWDFGYPALDTSWVYEYGNLSDEDFKARVYARAVERVDIAAIMLNPNTPASQLQGPQNHVSLIVAEHMAAAVRAHPETWKLIQPLKSPWGDVEVYRNLQRQPVTR